MAKSKTQTVIEIPEFDYRNLKGEEFDKYISFIESLPWEEKLDFELYPAEGVFKMILNDNLDKEKKLVGIRLKDTQPKHTTRIPVMHAKDLNSQIEQNSAAGTGFYYLLKKS